MHTKKITIVLIVLILILLQTVVAQNNKVTVDEKVLKLPVHMEGDKIQVPLRETLEALKYEIKWNPVTHEVYVNAPGNYGITYVLKSGNNYIEVSKIQGFSNVKEKKELPSTIVTIKGNTYVPLEMLDILGISNYVENNNVYVYTKLLLVGISQESEFVENVMDDNDIKRVESLIHAYGTRNGIYAKQFDYLDSRPVEDLYTYISTLPTEEEMVTGYRLSEFTSANVNKNTLQSLTRAKTIISLTEMDLEFEPVVYYRIGGKVDLIGGYVNHSEIPNLDSALQKYTHNYQETSWVLLNNSQKQKVRGEISKFYTELQKSNDLVILLLQDGEVVYME